MHSHVAGLTLILAVTAVAALTLSSSTQNSPTTEKTAEAATAQPDGRFPAMLLKTHSIFTQSELRPAWQMKSGGQLTVTNGTVQFGDSDPKDSFSFPIDQLSSLERRRGPEGFPVLRIKLQNGKHFDLVSPGAAGSPPAANGDFLKAMGEGLDVMEKAIRDMASHHGVAFK